MRKLILHQPQAVGDIVMLTTAVRDLHAAYPGEFLTDVRTPFPPLWEHNPWITPLDDSDPAVETIHCEYPLIHRSNSEPVHFVHGFIEFLNQRLGLQIRLTRFAGDIHLSDEERRQTSQVEQVVGQGVPFWILVAGGKRDFTIKWWDRRRYQQVVDAYRGRLLFVQIGELGHSHPPLDGVLDLRGKTDLRQLVRLVHHAQGVVCPVTALMHLAAAVEVRPGAAVQRPCVVVAGGREPVAWAAYPHHRFLHTIGALPCCADGGCWRSRTLPIGDGEANDLPEHLCVDVVGTLPRCMDMIRAEHVAAAIQSYLDAGDARTLTAAEAEAVRPALRRAADARARRSSGR